MRKEFKDPNKVKAGKVSAETKASVASDATEISSEISTDLYADIRKYSKFKDPEELVTRIIALRDEGYNYRELWEDPMAVKIPSYTYVTMMITRGKPLEKVLQAMREGPLHKLPDSQGPRASEYRRASYTKQETCLLTELNKRGIHPEQPDLSIVKIHHDSCLSSKRVVLPLCKVLGYLLLGIKYYEHSFTQIYDHFSVITCFFKASVVLGPHLCYFLWVSCMRPMV